MFVSNAKRYVKLADMMDKAKFVKKFKFIFTSNVTPVDYKPDFILNYESLLATETTSPDNSLFLLLNFLKRVGVKTVDLAGIDGYKQSGFNYSHKGYEMMSLGQNVEERNINMSKALSAFNKEIKIRFITPTIYKIQ
jgi:4-hydroxy 2-oxovalerate aldolase